MVVLLIAATALAAAAQTYRFDDRFLSTASVSAPPSSGALRLAEPVRWDFDTQQISWQAARGRIGFKPGQLMVQGQGSTPVLVSPSNPAIDWSRYEAIVIRMIAEGGTSIKVKLGDTELSQKLGPAMQPRDYRFALDAGGVSYTRPLAVMPTDDVNATVAIDSISLVPRLSPFSRPAGVINTGKQEEYRNAIFARAPASVTYEAPVPAGATLRFGVGIGTGSPVTFRILVTAAAKEVFSVTVRDPNSWQDMVVDLSPYAAPRQKITFRTESAAPDGVGLWANPLLTAKTAARRPNILLYVVCTLRPDHTSLYGYGRDTTPFLKAFGASSSVFDDSTAQAPWTKPSVASLMTSLHAWTHGLVNDTDTIPAGAPTLASQLRQAGYTTGSIVANPFAGRTSGLERGFDYMMEYPVVQRNRTDRTDRGTDSAAINRAIAPWIDEHSGEPFFLYVQSTDPHAPYRPPAAFEAKFANPAETPAFDVLYGKLRDIRAYGGGATVTHAEIRSKGGDPALYARQAIDRYDAEIAHNDTAISGLIGQLKKAGVYENTIVVIASDHGEEFWEHGYGAHGHSLYAELIRTVLLMRVPGLAKDQRISEPVQLIDVMPTLLELAGAPPAPRMQGQSLVPLLKGQPFRRQSAIYSSKLPLPRAKPGGGVPENLTGTVARIDGGLKILYRPDAARAGMRKIEIYDRRSDRADSTDISARQSATQTRIEPEIVRWIEAQMALRKQLGPAGQTKIDTQNLERLRSLGYTGGTKKN